MKRTFIIAVLSVLFTSIATAQELKDKLYFDEDWNEIEDANEAAYYRLYNADDKSEGRKPYKDFFINGKLQGEGFIVWRGGEMLDDGPQKNYHENGKLRQTWTMKMGKMEGENYHYDTTGTLHRIFNYKNDELDGKQTQYFRGEVDLEDYFVNGVLQKEITYIDGKIRRIFALVSRQDTTFVANDTWYYREDEDSLIGKNSVDKIYNFPPSTWEYPFSMHFVHISDFSYDEETNKASYGAISEYHGKFQSFDRQNRIIKDGQYSYGEKVGIWKTYDYSQNYYYTYDYDNNNDVTRYYTLDNKPFTGKVTTYEADGVKIDLNIKDGIRCGQYIAYHYDDDGEVIGKYYGNYDNAGQYDGYFHAEMFIDGEWKTVDFSNYKHGVEHGEWRTIANDSIIFKNYNNGELDGEYQICTINSREDYAKSKDSLWTLTHGYYTTGKRSGHWWITISRKWQLNQREGNFVEGKAEGEWIFYTTYTPDGYIGMQQIDAIINFHNGQKEGKAVTFKNKSNAPFKDSIDIVAYFKNDELDGAYERHDNDGNIIVKGNYSGGEEIGVWTYSYPNENIYQTRNYDNQNVPDRFYTLDDKPFTGKHTETYEKEDGDEYDTIVITIKNSLIQQVESIDSETGKVIDTKKFKKGLPE
ncbi:MAG: hypothetical protein II956_03550 [Bacteroidales bacterium]|nr:hypothetical protein [Bacteroidales bacterium]